MFDHVLLPKLLKEILTNIPSIAFKIVDWKTFLRQAAPLMRRMSQKNPDPLILENLHHLQLSTFGLKTTKGENVLRIFFGQLLDPAGVFLDLRPKHFVQIQENWHFRPNNLWVQLNDTFHLSLINLYCGFYWNNHALFDQALVDLGLTKNLSDNEKNELNGLFRKHFGMGDQEEIEFRLHKFQESFYELFKFFLDKQVKLETDFLYLGVYLATLYLHLEELGGKYNVKKIFLEKFPDPHEV